MTLLCSLRSVPTAILTGGVRWAGHAPAPLAASSWPASTERRRVLPGGRGGARSHHRGARTVARAVDQGPTVLYLVRVLRALESAERQSPATDEHEALGSQVSA